MGEDSKIEWTDHTFNPWIGCEKVSPGCKHCYASTGTSARVSASRGLPLWGPGSSRQITTRANWRKPIAWDKAAAEIGVRARVFCASLADVFEDRPDLVEPRARLAALVQQTQWLDWLLLTKRPENADRLMRAAMAANYGVGADPWLPNVWLGTTCEDQAHAEERLPHLLSVPARVRFVSYEPAIGPVDFARITLVAASPPHGPAVTLNALTGHVEGPDDVLPHRVDWVIVGGESGGGARPFDPRWALSAIAQCEAAGVACFVKQLGAKPGANLHTERGRGMHVDDGVERFIVKHPKGGDWTEWPKHLRVREWPTVRP